MSWGSLFEKIAIFILGLALTMLGISNIHNAALGVSLIGLGIASLIFGIVLSYREGRRKHIAPPSIMASIEAEGGDWYLKIENKGGPATFESRMRIIAANGETLNLNEYTGYWETPPHREARIVRGSPKRLRVGGVLSHNQGLTMVLLLYFYDPKTDGLLLRQSTLYIVGTQPPASPKPEFHLRITISAEPQFKNGQPVIKEYNMTLTTFDEIKKS